MIQSINKTYFSTNSDYCDGPPDPPAGNSFLLLGLEELTLALEEEEVESFRRVFLTFRDIFEDKFLGSARLY